jgi:DNA-directed RNA polymerase subunit RPC12/RpoP
MTGACPDCGAPIGDELTQPGDLVSCAACGNEIIMPNVPPHYTPRKDAKTRPAVGKPIKPLPAPSRVQLQRLDAPRWFAGIWWSAWVIGAIVFINALDRLIHLGSLTDIEPGISDLVVLIVLMEIAVGVVVWILGAILYRLCQD